jgi:hypothetical protein
MTAALAIAIGAAVILAGMAWWASRQVSRDEARDNG